MTAPPDYVIEAARLAALESPCAKSKRGVVLYSADAAARLERLIGAPLPPAHHDLVLVSRGFNGQPAGFACTGSWSCRGACAKLCLHAEQRAIFAAGERARNVELVHVKIDEAGRVVPGGGPSCWQCSRLVVEAGLHGVWLYEAQRWHVELRCCACRRITRIEQDAGTTGVCEQCDYPGGLLAMPDKTIYDVTSGKWRFYSADDFHRATLRACGIGAAA